MYGFKHVIRLIAIAFLAMLTAAPAVGQTTVYSGQTSELSVVEVPGETYSWQLFNDHNGVNFATAFGNCPPSNAFLVDDISTGPVINVTWLEPGTYFYKVTAFNECTSNFKIGMVTVLPLIDGQIQLRAEDEANSCVGNIVGVPIRVVENFNEIATFRIQLSFNSSVIKFTGFKNLNKKLTTKNLTYVEISPGVLNLIYNNPGGSLSIDDGQALFDAEFQGIGEGKADIKWNTLECSIRTTQNVKTPALYVVRDLYQVSRKPQISITQSNPVICQGEPISMSAKSTDDQNVLYRWVDPYNNVFPGSEVNILSANPLNSGKYRLIATNDGSCETRKEVDIVVNPKPVLQIATDDTICLNGSYLLDAGGNFSEYEWNTGTSGSTYMVTDTGTYSVKIVDRNGCTASQKVLFQDCFIEADAPNAFSPNGDGVHETFKPLFKGCEMSRFRMSIYNRWGELIFTTTNKDEGWDGRSNGEMMPMGVYVYVISFEVPGYVNQRKYTSPMTGKVTLLR